MLSQVELFNICLLCFGDSNQTEIVKKKKRRRKKSTLPRMAGILFFPSFSLADYRQTMFLHSVLWEMQTQQHGHPIPSGVWQTIEKVCFISPFLFFFSHLSAESLPILDD